MKNQIKFKNQINRTCPFKSKLVGNPRNFKKCQLKFKTIKSYKILSFLKIFKEYTRLGLLKNLINKKKTKSFNKKKKSKFQKQKKIKKFPIYLTISKLLGK